MIDGDCILQELIFVFFFLILKAVLDSFESTDFDLFLLEIALKYKFFSGLRLFRILYAGLNEELLLNYSSRRIIFLGNRFISTLECSTSNIELFLEHVIALNFISRSIEL